MWMSGWLPDAVLDGLAGIGRHFSNFQTVWEFEMSKWMFGSDKPSAVFRQVMYFTLGSSDAPEPSASTTRSKTETSEPYLHKIRCPVMITGAGQSLYFHNLDETTNKIYRHLVHVPEEDKVIWVPQEPSDGGFQAQVGAFGMMQMKTIAFLDDKFGIKRKPLL